MKTVFIVEGTNDSKQIHKAFENDDEIVTLVTEGTKVNHEVKVKIEMYLSKGHGVYILSDPDEAGEQLASMVQYYFPDIERIEPDLKQCAYYTGKKYKAGIEYSSYKYLRRLLSPYMGRECPEEENLNICWD